jgi:O-acetyl-ADP-ribose deacetylase (regulator of RNase III)
MQEWARQTALAAIEGGWSGPPFSPFELADYLGVDVVAHEDLRDARLVVARDGSPRIEYNPNRPRGRLRFSIAHELAHTFFTDYKDEPRYRSAPPSSDAWQVELLCDIAAAELLMPLGSFAQLEDEPLQIARLMELRQDFDVSAEAVVLRAVKLTDRPGAAFTAARTDGSDPESSFRIDYVVPSRAGWSGGLTRGREISAESALGDCTAIGFTAIDRLEVGGSKVSVECVGIPPYPGDALPRILGIALPSSPTKTRHTFKEVYGDATNPVRRGRSIIAHVVNDRALTWGGSFGKALRARYPSVQDDFRRWMMASAANRRLGNVHFFELDDRTTVASMVAQHGFGQSRTTRLRYGSLSECLRRVAEEATTKHATVHLPRIGTGAGGADWRIVRELIRTELADKGAGTTVYAVPDKRPPTPAQQVLLFD